MKLQSTKKQLQSKNDLLKKETDELVKKANEKEKFSNLLHNKIKSVNEEKIKIIQDITQKRNDIVIETENYVKDIQQKFQNELPEKQKLLEENQRLRQELDEFSKKSVTLKEEIEKEIKHKEKIQMNIKNDFINRTKQKMEKIQAEKEALVTENYKLKSEYEGYNNSKDERDKTLDKYMNEWDKFSAEIENVKFFYLFIYYRKKMS